MTRWIPVLGVVFLCGAYGCDAGEEPEQAPSVLDIAAIRALMADETASRNELQSGDAEEMAWMWFVALNSPLTGPASKYWESWKQTSEVYLSDGSRPLPWGENPPLPDSVVRQAMRLGLDMNRPFHNLDADLQVDGLVLRDVFRQDVRYQLLMNEEAFDYILARGIYNVNGQESLAQNNSPAAFPWNAWELKTSWIWIGADQTLDSLQSRFYVVNAYYQVLDDDGLPTGYAVGRAALTGMHIISKLTPNWVWTTFQNVHDSLYTLNNAQPRQPMKVQLPISEAAQRYNAIYQEELRDAGSIFANYQLIGVQTEFVEGGQATLLANSQIESAFQSTSSCITCHATASYSVSDGYFNIVDSGDGGTVYYTGAPPDLTGYTSLDFVWSLKRAHYAR